MDVNVISRFFALLAFVALAGAVLVALSSRATSGVLGRIRADVAPLALPLAWLVAATCMIGSLYYSEVVHLLPCRLCWYQRIAMYPLAVILAIATARRDAAVRRYAIPLAAIGLVVSIYHVQLERFPEQASFCSVDVPCNVPPIEQFGFVTLAFMAGSGFAAIIALLAVAAPARPTPTREAVPGHQPLKELV